MNIKIIDEIFSICKIRDVSEVNFTDTFCFVSKTDEEISLVCPSNSVPKNVSDRSDGWKAFRIQGQLDFSLVGILSTISTILAEQNISIFAVSTYNTDYVLTKSSDFKNAVEYLKEKGFTISN